jgi:hypothetical protein
MLRRADVELGKVSPVRPFHPQNQTCYDVVSIKDKMS